MKIDFFKNKSLFTSHTLSFSIKRLTRGFIGLFSIVLLTLFTQNHFTKDPVSTKKFISELPNPSSSELNYQKQINFLEKNHLSSPVFYFSFYSSLVPDTVLKIQDPIQKQFLIDHCIQSKSPKAVMQFYRQLAKVGKTNRNWFEQFFLSSPSNYTTYLQEKDSILLNGYQNIWTSEKESLFFRMFPKLVFNGASNQFHHFFFSSDGILHGSLGTSYAHGTPVSSKLKSPILWTVSLNALSLIISILLSLVFSQILAFNQHKGVRWAGNFFIYLSYGIPSFWLATILLWLLANPDHLDWFEGNFGFFDWQGASVWQWVPYLVLPITCMSFLLTAYLTKQLSQSLNQTKELPFVLHAERRGLSKMKVRLKHILPYSMLSYITIITQHIPHLIAGSVIIETIFGIPGIGKLLYDSVLQKDFPVVLAIVFITSLLTIFSLYISDLIQLKMDKRVQL